MVLAYLERDRNNMVTIDEVEDTTPNKLVTMSDDLRKLEHRVRTELSIGSLTDVVNIKVLRPFIARAKLMELDLDVLLNMLLYQLFADAQHSFESITQLYKTMLFDELKRQHVKLSTQLATIDATLAALEPDVINPEVLEEYWNSAAMTARINKIKERIVKLCFDREEIYADQIIQQIMHSMDIQDPEWLEKIIRITNQHGLGYTLSRR